MVLLSSTKPVWPASAESAPPETVIGSLLSRPSIATADDWPTADTLRGALATLRVAVAVAEPAADAEPARLAWSAAVLVLVPDALVVTFRMRDAVTLAVLVPDAVAVRPAMTFVSVTLAVACPPAEATARRMADALTVADALALTLVLAIRFAWSPAVVVLVPVAAPAAPSRLRVSEAVVLALPDAFVDARRLAVSVTVVCPEPDVLTVTRRVACSPAVAVLVPPALVAAGLRRPIAAVVVVCPLALAVDAPTGGEILDAVTDAVASPAAKRAGSSRLAAAVTVVAPLPSASVGPAGAPNVIVCDNSTHGSRSVVSAAVNAKSAVPVGSPTRICIVSFAGVTP